MMFVEPVTVSSAQELVIVSSLSQHCHSQLVISLFPVQKIEEQEYEVPFESLKDGLTNKREGLQRVNRRRLTEQWIACKSK